ncbi:MAG: hypothetical protein FWC39_05035 [Bacteroidetes bacterium]|nr:hypothetical protein [Bacteroidota bacterium]
MKRILISSFNQPMQTLLPPPNFSIKQFVRFFGTAERRKENIKIDNQLPFYNTYPFTIYLYKIHAIGQMRNVDCVVRANTQVRPYETTGIIVNFNGLW